MAEKLSKADTRFLAAIVERGGEKLAPTNPYEVMRFKTCFGVGVVYEGRRGRTWNSEARQARDHLESRKGGSLAPVKVHGRRAAKGTVDRLLERDGDGCFFCGQSLGDDITVEHLVPVAHGGPNHVSNLFLSHGLCNREAGHLSAPEKVARAILLRSPAVDTPATAPASEASPPLRHNAAPIVEVDRGQPGGEAVNGLRTVLGDALHAEQVRQAIDAIGMDEKITLEESRAWLQVARVGTHGSFLRLQRMLKL